MQGASALAAPNWATPGPATLLKGDEQGLCVREGGEVAACVADVDSLEREIPMIIQQHACQIRSASMLLLDGNLPPEVLLVRTLLSLLFPITIVLIH